jgi:hypothetical protein
MFSESVAQYPIIAVSDGQNTFMNSPWVANFDGCDRIGPNPPALTYAHHKSAKPTTMRNGAAHDSRPLIDSVPCQMKCRLISQKRMKARNSPVPMPTNDGMTFGIVATPGQRTFVSSKIALPPIQVWMPNHPQATNARSSAGRFAPSTPKDGHQFQVRWESGTGAMSGLESGE